MCGREGLLLEAWELHSTSGATQGDHSGGERGGEREEKGKNWRKKIKVIKGR